MYVFGPPVNILSSAAAGPLPLPYLYGLNRAEEITSLLTSVEQVALQLSLPMS